MEFRITKKLVSSTMPKLFIFLTLGLYSLNVMSESYGQWKFVTGCSIKYRYYNQGKNTYNNKYGYHYQIKSFSSSAIEVNFRIEEVTGADKVESLWFFKPDSDSHSGLVYFDSSGGIIIFCDEQRVTRQ